MGISTFALGGSVDESHYYISRRRGNIIKINSAHTWRSIKRPRLFLSSDSISVS